MPKRTTRTVQLAPPTRRAGGRGEGSPPGRGGHPREGSGGRRDSGAGGPFRMAGTGARAGWIAVVLVLVVALVLILVKITGGSPGPAAARETPHPLAPASLLAEVTSVPASVYDAIGSAGQVGALLQPLSKQPPLVVGGKPAVVYVGGEFCPYCAATRWVLVAALSRFGTFSGLRLIHSSPTDVDPSTPTFDFYGSSYTSPYVDFIPVEHSGPTPSSLLQPLTGVAAQVSAKYDAPPYTDAVGGGSGYYPFVDVGNRYYMAGLVPWLVPSYLDGLSYAQIAAELHDPTTIIGRLWGAATNEMVAAVCSIDGGQPGAVCDSPGVQAGLKALGTSAAVPTPTSLAHSSS
jgi:thiol-disulfide isomerase/thioredoxin